MFRKDIEIVYQSERAECGLACLVMVLSSFDHEMSLVELRKKYEVSSNGLTLENLIQILNEQGMSVRPLKLEPENLGELKLPCILHWNMNHFVVLSEVNKHNIVILDPAKGKQTISYSEVNDRFTGVALEAYPSVEFEEKLPQKKFSLSQLWSSADGLIHNLIKTFLFSIFFQILTIVTPYYLQLVVDKAVPTHDRNLLSTLLVGFIIILIFQQVIYISRAYLISYISSSFSLQVASNLFKHLIALPLSFFEKRDVGDLVTRFDSLDKIREFISENFVAAILDGIMVISILVVLLNYHIGITLIVLFFSATYLIFRLIAFKHFRKLSEETIRHKAAERSDFIENVQNIQTMMLYDAQHIRGANWNNLYANFVGSKMKVIRLQEWFKVGNNFIFGLEHLILVFFFANTIIENELSIGMMIAFLAYKIIFTQRVAELIDKTIEYKMLDLHLERVSEIALEDKINDGPLNSSQDFEGEVELSGISYRYDSFSKFMFEKINLKVEAGDYIAITGPSGVGKSTLVKIILGLLEPAEGELLINDKPISQFGRKNYRKQVATIMQDDFLYAGSISDNITFFDTNPDMDRVCECAKLAQVHNAIERKPMGYNSFISHMGNTLSGGEKQRIMLARALYKKPKLIVMDEATSNLDTKTEQAINKAIASLNITRIIVAHRPQTISQANKVYHISKDSFQEMKFVRKNSEDDLSASTEQN